MRKINLVHDSNAKLPSGLLRGNVHQLGDFEQCLKTISGDETFSGQYCLTRVKLTIPNQLQGLKHLKESFVQVEIFPSSIDEVKEQKNFKLPDLKHIVDVIRLVSCYQDHQRFVGQFVFHRFAPLKRLNTR